MRKILAFLAITLMTTVAFSQTKSTIIHSSVNFKIRNMGISVSGTISGLAGDFQFNPADPASSLINASADANTINTDNNSRDEHLKSSDFFDVARYPKITLKSVSINHKGGNSYSGIFNLTMKDKTKQVEIPFTYSETANSATFKGSFKINRLDFGVGGNSLILSNEVAVNIEVETSKP